MQANRELRAIIRASKVCHWQIADDLGISEGTFCKMMRYELPLEKKQKILAIIEERRKETE